MATILHCMSLLFPCISFIVLLCVFFGLLFLILSF
ncbi:putative membrane protein, partial [Chlamydia ibidis]